MLETHWETIEHPHKHLIDKDFLKSGYHLEYPEIVARSAVSLAIELGWVIEGPPYR